MKRNVVLILIFTCFCTFVFSQQNSRSNKPKEDIKVNKQYDEKGNLVGYDSTYVYSWSSDSTLTEFPGSIDFQEFFGDRRGFFNHDSLFFSDPFQQFGFQGDLQNLFGDFEKMFSDSTNTDYFSFQNDSSLIYNNDSIHQFGFRFGDDFFIDDYEKQLNDTTKHHQFPEFSHHFYFNNDSIMKKQEQKMKEYMKEIEKWQKQFFNME